MAVCSCRPFHGGWNPRSFGMGTVASIESVRCVVVDDHLMVAQLLCGVLRTLAGIDVVAAGCSLQDTERLSALAGIDLLIVDCTLGDGNGFDLIRGLRESHPRLRCVVLTEASVAPDCPEDLEKNIVATVRKDQPFDALLAAIEEAAGQRLKPAFQLPRPADIRAKLTSRQCDVFAALGQGLTNKEIAKALEISVQTVETHRKMIARKLGCTGASLVRVATLARLVPTA